MTTLERSDRPVVPQADRDGLSDDARRIADLMGAMMRSHHAIKLRLTGGPDTDLGQLTLLVKLSSAGPRRASTLADQLCADPSTVSRQVAALVRAGLVERRSDPDDGRASILVLTPSGHDRVAEFADTRAQAVAPIVGEWSDPDRQVFIRLLERYLADFERHRDGVVDRFTHSFPGAVAPTAAATAAAVDPSERDSS